MISEFVSSNKSVFLCFLAFYCNASMISKKIFLAHAQLQNSVNKAHNTKKELTQISNETKTGSLDESFAECLGNIIEF